jgi:2-iminobutanoate/2-iminopropanoate deaminase
MKQVIHTDNAPKALGPYSQAIRVDNIVYTAGQICLDPKTGDLNNATLKEEMSQVMSNLSAVLEAANSSLDNVVKSTIFVSDLGKYGEINQLYGEYFSDAPPARSTVEVARLPKDVNVEIEMIAVCD